MTSRMKRQRITLVKRRNNIDEDRRENIEFENVFLSCLKASIAREVVFFSFDLISANTTIPSATSLSHLATLFLGRKRWH